MYDFHTHILPKMDDGSKSVEESLAMLSACVCQGVNGIAATPHFYAEQCTPDKFVIKREYSFQMLSHQWKEGLPPIRLGAEVYYYEGMEHSEEVLKLRMEGSNVLLVEMPMIPWSSYMVHALCELNRRREITVLLAHIERYLPYQNPEIWLYLRQQGICLQSSASFFLQRRTRRRAIRMFQNGAITVLGSDCHNMVERAPNLGEAVELIRRLHGEEVLAEMEKQEEILLT